jgi:hypothetical protein
MPKYEGFSNYEPYSATKTIEGYTVNDYGNLVLNRDDLDKKLKEISRNRDSVFTEQKMQNDANIYTGLLLTVLASSLLVYVFIKMG